MNNFPYTYLVGWPTLNLWYYGVRYARKCSPDDFFVNYFTSSKLVHALMLRHGLPPVREVRKIFQKPKQAIVWEQTVLRRMNVLYDNRWLNQNISGAIHFTDEMRRIMSERKKGRVWLEKGGRKTLVLKELAPTLLAEGYIKFSPNMKGSNNGMWGRKHSAGTKQKIKQRAEERGCTLTESGRERKSVFMQQNNPMFNASAREKYDRSMQAVHAKNRRQVKRYDQLFQSITQAANICNIPLSTLYWQCRHKKNGWSFNQPSRYKNS